MCQTACPVLIDTGDLTRRLRGEQRGRAEERVWRTAAQHWDGVTRAAATGLSVARAVPDPLPVRATAAGRAVLGHETVPAWSADLPAGGTRRSGRSAGDPVAVYFPACISTMFGPAAEGVGVREAFLALCERAEVEVRVPDRIASLCCGTPWKSKGLSTGYAAMREQVVPAVREASDDGRLPVVVDAASCTEGLVRLLEDAGVRVVDAVAFVDEVLLPRLPAGRRVPSVMVHQTCSSTQLGINASLVRVAAAAAEEVVTPVDWSCCAFAGDRGLLHPELTASATAAEAREVGQRPASAYASVNRTCELGMTRATGHPYQHVLELLEVATRVEEQHDDS
jgi:D-lactate dehydrogenase